MSEITTLTQTLREAISACIYGKEDVIEKVLAALYCGGHGAAERYSGNRKNQPLPVPLPEHWTRTFTVSSLHQTCCLLT